MGWNNGTIVFDAICEVILDDDYNDKKEAIKKIIQVLDDMDWDCHNESDYWKHPIVVESMKEIHPEWFDDDS